VSAAIEGSGGISDVLESAVACDRWRFLAFGQTRAHFECTS